MCVCVCVSFGMGGGSFGHTGMEIQYMQYTLFFFSFFIYEPANVSASNVRILVWRESVLKGLWLEGDICIYVINLCSVLLKVFQVVKGEVLETAVRIFSNSFSFKKKYSLWLHCVELLFMRKEENNSPESTLCADSYLVSVQHLCYHSGM